MLPKSHRFGRGLKDASALLVNFLPREQKADVTIQFGTAELLILNL